MHMKRGITFSLRLPWFKGRVWWRWGQGVIGAIHIGVKLRIPSLRGIVAGDVNRAYWVDLPTVGTLNLLCIAGLIMVAGLGGGVSSHG